MSKAFTNEDAQAPELALPSALPTSGEPRWVTPEGYEALREELQSAQPGSRRAKLLAATVPLLAVHQPVCDGRANFGCWVTVEDEEGAEQSFRLVGADEADARAGRISAASPLARALLGKRPGESAVVELPRGPVEYTVVAVSAQQP